MRRQVKLIALVALLVTLAAQAGSNTYGPVKAGQSLSSIAYQLRPDKTRTGTYQTMLAIYRANRSAFEQGEPGRLRPGSMLSIPSAQVIRAVDPQQALHFYTGKTYLLSRPQRRESERSDQKKTARHKIEIPPQILSADQAKPELRELPGTRRAIRKPEAAALPDPNRDSGLQPVPPPPAWQPQDADKAPVPDRWRILDSLGLMHTHWYDPYNQNTLKGDRPLWGNDKFFILSLISDSIFEPRRLPTPVGQPGTSSSGALGIFGGETQSLLSQSVILSTVYVQGDTTFRPPDVEYHFTPVFNFNRTITDEAGTVNIDPARGRSRNDTFVGVQELFADYHLRNVSAHYDFDSVRMGIQPFSSDFRGFLFQDNQLALRLFGIRDNNRWQYNLAWIRRLEKDTNSGLNDLGTRPRNDDIFVANLYRQDFPVRGFTSQVIVAHNRNREDGRSFYNDNGFIERPASFGNEIPHRYQMTYLGYNGDGHFGRVNLTASTYFLTGTESHGAFTEQSRRVRAGFGAAELSVDTDWARWRLSGLWASGDRNPYGSTSTGYDAIFENPVFAGADTSFWIRQSVPLIGGGGVALSTRNGVLNDLRSSKEHGQSNFDNPGTQLIGVGADFDLMPVLRLSTNANYLRFDNTAVLEAARNQGDINREIGYDLSAALIYRPLMTQNIVFRLSGAWLLPGEGFRQLFPDVTPYSILGNLILSY